VLKSIGCKCFYENNTIIVKSDNLMDINIPEKPVREMRSSIILLGAMIARTGQAKISYPGGYDIIMTDPYTFLSSQ
jgi:UDP-N-acetylglucosamine 1-carboxyvinyltransferase